MALGAVARVLEAKLAQHMAQQSIVGCTGSWCAREVANDAIIGNRQMYFLSILEQARPEVQPVSLPYQRQGCAAVFNDRLRSFWRRHFLKKTAFSPRSCAMISAETVNPFTSCALSPSPAKRMSPSEILYQPALITTHRPFTMVDGHNVSRRIYEFVTRLAAEVDDIVVGSKHPIG